MKKSRGIYLSSFHLLMRKMGWGGKNFHINATASFAEWWRRSSLFCSAFIDCAGGLRAVAFIKIYSILLPARMQAISHLGSKWRLMSARVVWRAVSFSEIGSNLLKAKIPVGSCLGTKRRLMTARMILRAVAGCEMTFYRLKDEIWY